MHPISAAVAAFKTSLTSPRHQAELSRARPAHPPLAALPSPADVLAALSPASPLSREAKDALLLSLVAEHQRTRHPLWQSLLLATYEGMLHNVAKRTLGVGKDDARQGALLGFFEALAKMPLAPAPKLPSLWLRYATERVAFGQGCFAEEPQAEPLRRRDADPRSLEEAIEEGDQLRHLTRELVALFGEEEAAREILDVLLEVRTGKEPLLEYVDAKHAGLSVARRDAIISRLHRMRARALAHLHKMFGGDLGTSAEATAA